MVKTFDQVIRRFDGDLAVWPLYREDGKGAWVSSCDYAALESENARLREALREIVVIGNSLGCNDPDCQHASCAMLRKAREVLGDA